MFEKLVNALLGKGEALDLGEIIKGYFNELLAYVKGLLDIA